MHTFEPRTEPDQLISAETDHILQLAMASSRPVALRTGYAGPEIRDLLVNPAVDKLRRTTLIALEASEPLLETLSPDLSSEWARHGIKSHIHKYKQKLASRFQERPPHGEPGFALTLLEQV